MSADLTRKELGRLLAEHLQAAPSPRATAHWAHALSLDHSFEPEARSPLMTLIAMDEGPEFVYDLDELRQLAADLSGG